MYTIRIHKMLHFFSSAYLIVTLSTTAVTQSPEYSIESFQSVYTELSSYQSIALLTMGDPLWGYEFQLDFAFPFYDSFYTRIFYEQNAWGSFTEDQDEALFLMYYGNSYTYDNVLDTSNITSDVRFSHVESNNMQAFVIQFTKARFFADPFADSLDTYFNFQLWFYENGIMEVHFGEFHMDNTPIYVPGKGFYEYTTSGGVDTTYVAGPHMSISHPLDEDNAIAIEGSYNDYEVVGDLYANLTVIPPEGWVIRFKPTFVSTTNTDDQMDDLFISPNPATSQVRIPMTDCRVIITDGAGKVVFHGISEDGILDVSSLPVGMYYLKVISDKGISSGKFVKT